MSDHEEQPSPRMPKGPKALRTIGEAAGELGLEPHVLRFWETKFPGLQPLKQRGGRRLYRPADMELLRHVQRLLHQDGYTIRGARRLLDEGITDSAKAETAGEKHDRGTGISTSTAKPARTRAKVRRGSSAHMARPSEPGIGPRDLQAAVAAAAEAGAFGTEGSDHRRLAAEDKRRLGRALDALTALRARLEAHRAAPETGR